MESLVREIQTKAAGFGFSYCSFCDEVYLPRNKFEKYGNDGKIYRACPDCIKAGKTDSYQKIE